MQTSAMHHNPFLLHVKQLQHNLRADKWAVIMVQQIQGNLWCRSEVYIHPYPHCLNFISAWVVITLTNSQNSYIKTCEFLKLSIWNSKPYESDRNQIDLIILTHLFQMLSDFFPEGIISGFDEHHKNPQVCEVHICSTKWFDVIDLKN